MTLAPLVIAPAYRNCGSANFTANAARVKVLFSETPLPPVYWYVLSPPVSVV